MDKHAPEVIQHENFLQLSPEALKKLISRDSFYAPEIDIFLAVESWVKANTDVNTSEVLCNFHIYMKSEATDFLLSLGLSVFGSKLFSYFYSSIKVESNFDHGSSKCRETNCISFVGSNFGRDICAHADARFGTRVPWPFAR